MSLMLTYIDRTWTENDLRSIFQDINCHLFDPWKSFDGFLNQASTCRAGHAYDWEQSLSFWFLHVLLFIRRNSFWVLGHWRTALVTNPTLYPHFSCIPLIATYIQYTEESFILIFDIFIVQNLPFRLNFLNEHFDHDYTLMSHWQVHALSFKKKKLFKK